jgi:mannose-1-phosphate guanylyltransferase
MTSLDSLPTQRGSGSHRWGVILAGGDGKRLLPLTRPLTGDERPKQFCDVLGGGTLLQQTRRRISGLIGEQRTLLVMTRTHRQFFSGMVDGVPPPCLLVQPRNQGTAPAILYGAMRVQAMDSGGVVAFFPSDHHFANGEALVSHIDAAFTIAEQHPGLVVLLGVVPESPEVSYGWIEPGALLATCAARPVFRVSRFWEKPDRRLASSLLHRGCLWNSFVMVGRVQAFLNLVGRAIPALLRSFHSVRSALMTGAESKALSKLYSDIPCCGFSDEVLSVCPQALAVLRGPDLGWSDLGEPDRVRALRKRLAFQFPPLSDDANIPPRQ